jgi:2-octaprenylphenol hydroxylase
VKPDYDVLIIGGGLVGVCLAGLLASDRSLQGLRIALIEAQPPSQPPPEDDIDLRVSAVSRASQAILARAGGWTLAPTHLSPYVDMKVWDATGQPDGPGSIHFSASSTSDPDLGVIVENRRLQWALYAAPAMRDQVTVMRASLTALTFDGETHVATAALSDGRRVTARLVVGADGAASHSRELAGIAVDAQSYDQAAVVTHVRTERPHARTAWQRFLPDGPLAFLPLADGRSSIVWSTSPAHAARLVEMPADDFERELRVASDAVLGGISLTAGRIRFPLQRMAARRYCRHGYVLVGDAAHAVHPLAGQGVNLGFADCASLTALMAKARTGNGTGWADYRVLRSYERERKSGNLLAAATIDGLGRVFGNADPRLQTLRRVGLNLLDRSPLAKRLLIGRATR